MSSSKDRRAALAIGGERWTSRIYAKQWDKAASTLSIDPDAMRRLTAHSSVILDHL